MSRVAKQPIHIPAGVEIKCSDHAVDVKGSKGHLSFQLSPSISVVIEGNVAQVQLLKKESKRADAIAGTTRAVLNNMVFGVSKGYEKKLDLVGVGYRAQVQGKKLNLSLGFSHPIHFSFPEGITIETPSQTEVIIKGADKQKVGQTAAEIRAFRPPEPYKGKGIKYNDEVILRKETKKK